MKTITVGQLRQNPTAMLAEVEAGETYRIIRHDHEVARVVLFGAGVALTPRRRSGGSECGAIVDVLALVPVTEGALAAAESVEPRVTTSDAIHLGSIIAAGLDAPVVSHDAGVKSAAARLGYPCHDPVAEE